MPRMVWWVLVIHLPIVNLVFFPSPSRKNEKYKKRGKKQVHFAESLIIHIMLPKVYIRPVIKTCVHN